MSISYIRKTYSCAHKIGDKVQIRIAPELFMGGQVGKILRARNARLVVKGATWQGSFHPSDVLPVGEVVTDPAEIRACFERDYEGTSV